VKVTVCIPTFNDADVIWDAIHSALDQTVKPLEVLVIDDGSDEPFVPRNAMTFALPDGVSVRVVRITNRGLPAARNTGLMLAKGDAFLPLDADDTIDPTYIEKTLPLLEAGADVVLTGLQEHGPHRNGTYMAGFDRPYDQVDEEILWQYNRFYYCSLFRTDYLRSVGGYNPRMAGGWGVAGGYEDWDLWIDLKRRGARFAAVDEPLLFYTTKPDSMLTRAEANRDVLVAEMRRHHAV
jgi:glycosyltransferase involved in cell wall biosynthesis